LYLNPWNACLSMLLVVLIISCAPITSQAARDKTTIVCDAQSEIENPTGFVLKLTKPLPTPRVLKGPFSSASMIELEDGSVCNFISGASGATDGVRIERINYSCRISSKNVVIFADVQPGRVWIAERGILVEQKTRDDRQLRAIEDGFSFYKVPENSPDRAVIPEPYVCSGGREMIGGANA